MSGFPRNGIMANGYGIVNATAPTSTPAVALTQVSAVNGGMVNLPATTSTVVFTTPSLAVGTWLISCQVDLLTSAVAGGEYDLVLFPVTATGTPVPQSSTFIDVPASAARVTMSLDAVVVVTVAGTYEVYIDNNSSSAATAEYTNTTAKFTTGYSCVRIA